VQALVRGRHRRYLCVSNQLLFYLLKFSYCAGAGRNPPGTNIPNIKLIEAFQSANGRLLSLSALLDELLASVDMTRHLFEKRSRKIIFKRGIDSMPDELIAYIMDLLPEADSRSGKPRQGHIPMTQVCRRFRTIAINCPRLWCRFSGRMSLRQVELFLQRSGECKLDVDLSGGKCRYIGDIRKICKCTTILATLVKQCHRWERVSWTHELCFKPALSL
jgi:hypothetical protein